MPHTSTQQFFQMRFTKFFVVYLLQIVKPSADDFFENVNTFKLKFER